ncbi:mechanosensitive ion channel family protein [Namhaeicola litoreus]|uniref:Mechanosensitive ion channel family protein n=1 Tax=Namhaeicola litoreus TaxID=1052145 RepID=A0ABW3Y5S5_9FLAO
MEELNHFIYHYLIEKGVDNDFAKWLNLIVLVLVAYLFLTLIDFIIRKILLGAFTKISEKTSTQFDDYMVQNKLPRNIAHLVPLLIAHEIVPFVFSDFPFWENLFTKGLSVYSIILVIWIIRSLLHTLRDYFRTLPRLKDKPIESYIQVVLIITWFIGILLTFAVLTNNPIWKFITALGAASAIFLLIFKDTILGFVASIQVSANDMMRIGDWITFDKYGADGDVIEINLATVKVQNFDNTITTIPTYALISDSFKNWRGMTESGGRRIKRSLNIKMESVNFLLPERVHELKNIQLISEYINSRQINVDEYNRNNKIDKDLLINGRNLTNLGVFRKYVETYVEKHSAINKDMTLMVRQLAPTTQGIPIEIYAFSKDKRWQNYEYIMADIFDHLISAVPYFGLQLFELPSGNSFHIHQKTE